MPTATVRVKDKWLPVGKKRWVIKGEDDSMFGAAEALANRVVKGETYDLAYKEDHWQGKTYNVVEGIMAATSRPAAPASPSPAIPNQPFRTEDQQRSEDIAVLAIIKEWVGRIPVGDVGALAHALRSARAAWKQSKLPTTKIETGIVHDDMDDKIEF